MCIRARIGLSTKECKLLRGWYVLRPVQDKYFPLASIIEVLISITIYDVIEQYEFMQINMHIFLLKYFFNSIDTCNSLVVYIQRGEGLCYRDGYVCTLEKRKCVIDRNIEYIKNTSFRVQVFRKVIINIKKNNNITLFYTGLFNIYNDYHPNKILNCYLTSSPNCYNYSRSLVRGRPLLLEILHTTSATATMAIHSL